MIPQEQFKADVITEIAAQDAKWGPQWHSSHKWLSILGEEFGEACEAALNDDLPNLYDELVQVAAVAQQFATRIW